MNALKSGCLPFLSSYCTFAFAEKVMKSILLSFKVVRILFALSMLANELSLLLAEVGAIEVSFVLTADCNCLVEWQPIAVYKKTDPMTILNQIFI
jgi:hypothetical protein